MRIAMISYHTCPLATLGGKDTGGMNVYIKELTRQLGKMGHRVDVFTRSQDEHVPHVLHDLGYGNRVVHVRAGPEVPLPKQELVNHLAEFVSGIQEFVQSKHLGYNLIHSHYWMSGITAQELQLVWKVPVVHMFHTLGLMKQRVARAPSEIEGEYRISGEQKVLETADRVIAATPAEVAQLQWLYHADMRKIVVVPPGVDLSRFYPIPPDEAKEYIGVPPCDRMLLFVGRLEPLKGLDTLIQAIALLRQKGVSVCLMVIGGEPFDDLEKPSHDISPPVSSPTLSPERERLKTILDKFDVSDLVVFSGKRSQDTLPYYYSAAEAVVVPSHYESFGMVALEAMACGAPVVASQVGGLAYLVKDNLTGFTVPVDDPQILAEKLASIIQNPDLRQKFAEQAVLTAKEYSWEIIAAQIEQVYRQVLEEKKIGV